MVASVKKKLGKMLLEENIITEEQLREALVIHKSSGDKLGRVLINAGFVTEDDILEVLKVQLGIEYVNLNVEQIDNEAIESLSETIARNHNLIPIRINGSSIIVALNDPLNIFAIEDVAIYTGKQVKVVLAREEDIKKNLDIYYSKQEAIRAAESFAREVQEEDDYEDIGEENENSAPIIKIVNSIIEQAINAKASDIHIEPYDYIVRVRYRVDGLLHEHMSVKSSLLPPMVARIKILANIDISERRLPQDGRISYSYFNNEYDMRVSTLPTVFGEKIVIRIQNKKGFIKDKKEIGFSENDLKAFDRMIGSANGIILVSGPTGSGKTTTLYTILNELNSDNRNIITVEDPVESKIHGVNQVQVHHKAGLSFASALRSILRQDPDIIMIGEIRDSETAEIAVRSAITGHLVLSTIHTNDSPTTVSRLIDMGIEDFLIGSSLVGVISQRLVRRICEHCKVQYKPDTLEIKAMGLNENVDYIFANGEGCKHCKGTGYSGRTGIYEIMVVNDAIKKVILSKGNSDDIEKVAILEGMTTLSQSCIEKIIKGETTYEEYIRVAYSI
ncbi:GspE/PulE family protein [Clostridium cylindrosporum]|uniref:Type IV pilus assembly protein TapB n=1 Tax=Clostridium cylindrosporum DSM 605 TaxID=1121307 RepID=A0A0J8D5Z8_CLOCY|nr:GspE/PulE family protein [Clostridium cylindrosporum]KMT21282.1 type IV pilus assembly protein TapB [Clostridium cylindrosporum DSM 605]